MGQRRESQAILLKPRQVAATDLGYSLRNNDALWLRERNVFIDHSPAWKLLLGVQCIRQFQRCSNATFAPSSVTVTTSLSINCCDDPSEPVVVSPKSKKMELSVVSREICNLVVAE